MTTTSSATARSGRSPGLRADARRNQEALLRAAAAAFAERGGDDVALEEIARRAGVGIGTLYRHFPTRRALLEALYRDQVETLCAHADELLESDEPGDALLAWLRSLVAFSSTKRNLTASLLADLSRDDELFSHSSRAIREAATQLLARAQQAGAVRADTDATDLIRLVHAVSMAAEWAPGDDAQAGRLLSLVFDGVRREAPAGEDREATVVADRPRGRGQSTRRQRSR